MYVAVSGSEIIFQCADRDFLEQRIDEICNKIPDLFRREYITVMPLEDYFGSA